MIIFDDDLCAHGKLKAICCCCAAILAERERCDGVFGNLQYLAKRMVEERDFSAPEKQHRLAAELKDALDLAEQRIKEGK